MLSAFGLDRQAVELARQADGKVGDVDALLDFAEDPTLDDQTRSWVFQALRDITGQTLPRQAAAWRDWYLSSLRK